MSTVSKSKNISSFKSINLTWRNRSLCFRLAKCFNGIYRVARTIARRPLWQLMIVLIHSLTPYDHCQLPSSTTSVLKTDFPSPYAVCIAWKSGPLKIIALSQEIGRSSTKSYAVRTKCSLWRIILWPMTIKCQEPWCVFNIMYSAFLLDLPVASSLLFEAVKKAEKKCKGSQRESFFSSQRKKSRRRRFLSLFFATHWHWSTLTLILTLTLTLVYWHWHVLIFLSRLWKSSDRIILASMLKNIYRWGKKRGLVQGCAVCTTKEGYQSC